MRFEELPGIPKMWIDFTSGSRSLLSLFPARPDVQSLLEHADRSRKHFSRNPILSRILEGMQELSAPRAQKNIQGLRNPESVVVTANIDASLFGGAATQLWKCLTTIKICEELAQHGIVALPVGWIYSALPGGAGVPDWTVSLLDSHGDFHKLPLRRPDQVIFSASDPVPSNQVAELIERIHELGNGTFDPEVIEILKTAYGTETTSFSATARLISVLMNEWGMVVLNPRSRKLASISSAGLSLLRDRISRIDPLLGSREGELAKAGYAGESADPSVYDHCIPSTILPVIASVLDPEELYPFVKVLPAYDELGLVAPMAWPRVSATIMDLRSRRILEKNHLNLKDLFEGEERVFSRVSNAMPCSAPEKLANLLTDVERQLKGLDAVLLTDEAFVRETDACVEKVAYQIEKLKDRIEASDARKQEALRRQLRRACNSLAPNGRIQECELSGIHFLLRHSRALLPFLYKNLDINQFEHQLIPMD